MPDPNIAPMAHEPTVDLKDMKHLGDGMWRFNFELMTEQGKTFALAVESESPVMDLSASVVQAYMDLAQYLGDLAVTAEKTANRLANSPAD